MTSPVTCGSPGARQQRITEQRMTHCRMPRWGGGRGGAGGSSVANSSSVDASSGKAQLWPVSENPGVSVSRTRERLCRDSPLGGGPRKPDPRSRWICFLGGLHSPLWSAMVAMDTRGHPPEQGLRADGLGSSEAFRRLWLINCPGRNRWLSRRKNGRALSWLNFREMAGVP